MHRFSRKTAAVAVAAAAGFVVFGLGSTATANPIATNPVLPVEDPALPADPTDPQLPIEDPALPVG